MEKEQIYEKLKNKIGLEFIKMDEPMKNHTSFKIGGNADLLVIAKSEQTLVDTIQIAKEEKIPVTIIGNGTNLLVRDNGIRGIVIKIQLEEIKIDKQNENAIISLGAGVKNGMLAQTLLKQEIAGFEFASGIPGTIGGAVYMNAGAYGGEMKDIVTEVTYIDLDEIDNQKTIKKYSISNEQCQFEYRHSFFQGKNYIITNVKIKLPFGNKEEIQLKMNENMESRRTKQPIQYPSAGSTFKRGQDFITAKLIDECGLKGYKVGDAEVSTLHAGFVINKGNATANQVLELVEHVKKTVYEKCEKEIELEIKVIGEK